MPTANRALTIVTGASENHATPLLNLLFSLDRYEPGTRVVVYDLGLSKRTLGILRRQRRRVVPFRFADYPDHVGADNLRTYAWKPAMVQEVLRSEGLPLLYLDAGDLVHERLDRVRRELVEKGLYSPTSGDDLATWCHPATLEAMQVESELLGLRNRNAALVGFGATPLGRALIEDWFAAAMRPEIICPPGSSRQNHRFDQSVLTVLFYRASRSRGIALTDERLGISTHNDRRGFNAMCDFIRTPAPPDALPRPKRQGRRAAARKQKRRTGPLRRLWRKVGRLLRGAAARP